MRRKETSHDFSSDLFDSRERSVLEQIRHEGRLDSDREVSRLLNVLNDIINKYTRLNRHDHERVYKRLKRFLLFEYNKTKQYNLTHDEMYVWYLSTLTCFDQFKKQLDACRPDVPEDVYSEFRSVIDGFMRDYLSDFSNRNGTRDIGLLMEPEFDGADRLVNYVGGVDKQRISWESKSDETTYIAEPTKSQTPDASTEKILIGE